MKLGSSGHLSLFDSDTGSCWFILQGGQPVSRDTAITRDLVSRDGAGLVQVSYSKLYISAIFSIAVCPTTELHSPHSPTAAATAFGMLSVAFSVMHIQNVLVHKKKSEP